ncbi:cell division protein ZapE [Sphingomicrobium astaxanthinifaciens]|uniref:cell division protein ZapE n=1 Tax=Sphingomicrobium astaxanthinifaciens TaxID=1227949 RepID=UPI001FCC272C|nr:cell division protein ZapE [Sphingomicrobium astaxanthinifaciens]MCJ7421668.1 AFG1 family ATPase [Sphingomicrobium astaxanthinifaciens]
MTSAEGPVGHAYRALVEAGELRADADQARAVAALDKFAADLGKTRRGFLSRMFGRETPAPCGVYMWGGVGRGKSMLMDLAFESIAIERKKRSHFAPFMLGVHQRLRRKREAGVEDALIRVAEDIAEEARFLAFDEMMVTNSADAMIMSRLFTALIERGVGVVTTSNRPPSDLYKDGLNRELFLPFIELIERQMRVVPLNGPTDYRIGRMKGMRLWHAPLGDATTKAVQAAFRELTGHDDAEAQNVPSMDLDVGGGRSLHVPKALGGVGVFSFKRLCGEPRGSADYLAIARAFHTVILVGVPVMGPEMRNEAARFVQLIDALYEHGVKLIAAAAAAPEVLYPAGDGSFEFERTVSRLEEMRSADYLEEGHRPEGREA